MSSNFESTTNQGDRFTMKKSKDITSTLSVTGRSNVEKLKKNAIGCGASTYG
jgi:hypothetical protein